MRFGHVDFGFRGREIRLILLGETIAIGERERLVLGRGETADHQDSGQRDNSRPMIMSFLSHEELTF